VFPHPHRSLNNYFSIFVKTFFRIAPQFLKKSTIRFKEPNLSSAKKHRLIQLRTVSKMSAYCERLGDDAMGVQGSRARLVGMLAGGVWFRVVRAAVNIPADVDASVLHSAVIGGVVRPL